MICHSRAAGFVLGLRTVQMNGNHTYPEAVDNQLRTFNHIELFEEPLDRTPPDFPALPDIYDPTADLDQRARAYLYVNCAGCHVVDGGGNAKMDMKYYQTLKDTMFVNAPMHGDFGLTGAKIVTPGDPYASVLLYRLCKWGSGRMPHVGSNRHDEQGLDLIQEWIMQLPDISNDVARAEANQKTAETEGLDAVELERRLEEAQQLRTEAEQERAEAIRTAVATRHEVHTQTQAVFEILERATQQTVEIQTEEIGKLLSSSRTALMLARLVGQQSTDDGIRQRIIMQGVHHADANVRDLFERFLPESERTIRLGNIINVARILNLEGSVEDGRRFFFTAKSSQCNNCHRLEEKGGTIGPDLSQIGGKYKRHEILESLVNPSKKIDPKYQTHVLVTSSGITHTGIVLEKSEQHVVLNSFREGKAEILRLSTDDVELLVPQQKSLMPDGMLRDLTPQQAADLLAFLGSLKQEPGSEPSPP